MPPLRPALATAALLLVCARPLPAWCQGTQELEWLVNTMTRLCLSGGDQLSLHAAGSGEDDLMLRSQSADGKIEGEFYIERSRTEGLVGGISGSITTLQAEQASEVRRCLEPLRARLLEIGMAHAGAAPSRATTASDPVAARPVVPATRVPPPTTTATQTPVTAPTTTATATPPPITTPTAPVSATPSPVSPPSPKPPPSSRPTTNAVAFRYSPNAINESRDGFACHKAAMPMDFVICSFQEVYDINTQHAVAWWATIAHLDKPQRDVLVQDQKQWIADMLKSCGLPAAGKPTQAQAQDAAPCVRAAYVDRIRYLRNYQPA
jgi:uncharacterized protein YecT (DUF1311 family)